MSVVKNALFSVLTAAYLLGGVSAAEPVSPDAYCRQEAVDYGIQPEHVAEYVAGCIEAMGGAAAYAVPEEIAVPQEAVVDEGGLSPEVQTSSEGQ